MSELLGADTDVLDRSADSLRTEAQRVQDLRILAHRAVSELQGCWQGSDLIQLLRLWEQTSPLLAAASAALDTCAAQLRAQSTAQRAASQAGGYDGVTSGVALLPLSTTSPPPPPRAGSPADSATWWRSLSPAQQQQVTRLHPDWIGNRDGVSFAARGQANQSLLTAHRARLHAQERRLDTSLLGDLSMGLTNGEPHPSLSLTGGALALVRVSALNRVRDKLASLETITATLDKPGERQLLLLNLKPERAEAAIANGNADTADNVAVFVPGLAASVTGSLDRYDARMSELRRTAERESTNARADKSTATVTWIGYQAPQPGAGLLSANSVIGYQAAKNGAEKLVPFLQGVNASRGHDAHLTLLGHSYGSTTAALALRQTTGVNDAVFFGSPGLATDNAGDLKVAAGGRLSYIEAQLDPVGDFGRFGTDPSLLGGMHHPSALESTVVDPLTGKVRHFEGVTGHVSYLANGTTSQYNIALAVAGLPDRAVLSDGLDLGDALRLTEGNVLTGPPVLAASLLGAALAHR